MAITDSSGGSNRGSGSSGGGSGSAATKVVLWIAIVIGLGFLRYWLRHH
jgi:hypothetical protein